MGKSFESSTFGANLVSAFVGCLWLGIAWSVGCLYFLRFRQDRLPLRLLAAVMVLLATCDCAVSVAQSWNQLIARYGDVECILESYWVTGVIVALVGTDSLLLQTFFVYRIMVISRDASALWKVYAAVVELLSLTSAALAWYTAYYVNSHSSALAINDVSSCLYEAYSCAIVSEFLGTCALVWFLVLKPRRENRALGLADNSLFVKLARKAVETNMLTLAWHLVGIAMISQASEIGFWYALPAQSLTKVYAISLFANLLGRDSAKRANGEKDGSMGTAERGFSLGQPKRMEDVSQG